MVFSADEPTALSMARLAFAHQLDAPGDQFAASFAERTVAELEACRNDKDRRAIAFNAASELRHYVGDQIARTAFKAALSLEAGRPPKGHPRLKARQATEVPDAWGNVAMPKRSRGQPHPSASLTPEQQDALRRARLAFSDWRRGFEESHESIAVAISEDPQLGRGQEARSIRDELVALRRDRAKNSE